VRAICIGLAVCSLACGETPECENPGPVESCPYDEAACYNITFTGHWTATAQGGALPAGAHFTVLAGSVHRVDTSVWRLGQVASPGVEQIAETGQLARFLEEHADARARGDAASLVCGDRIGPTGTVHTSVVVPKSRPHISVISMVAPSSDWFVGVDSLSLLDDGGAFKDSIQVWLRLNDAGTERDDRAFSLANAAMQPAEPILDQHDQVFAPGARPLALLTLARVR
jgi:hypothetical protein